MTLTTPLGGLFCCPAGVLFHIAIPSVSAVFALFVFCHHALFARAFDFRGVSLVLMVVAFFSVFRFFFPLLLFQIIISIRSKDNHRPTAVEALRRAKFKFPGRQKILQSNKWGFTKYPREVRFHFRSRVGWGVLGLLPHYMSI